MSEEAKDVGKIEIVKVQERAQIVREEGTGRIMIGLVVGDADGKSHVLVFSQEVATAIHDALH